MSILRATSGEVLQPGESASCKLEAMQRSRNFLETRSMGWVCFLERISVLDGCFQVTVQLAR